MSRKLFLPLLVVLTLFLVVSGVSAGTVDRHVQELAPGLSARGYLLSADDEAMYEFSAPQGMTIRPRIEVDPLSSLRVQATLDMWPVLLTDDSCDDAVVEFEFIAPFTGGGSLTIHPCPGTMDIDAPFIITLNYDPVLLEQEPNNTSDTGMWLHGSEYESRVFLTYNGTIAPADDIDRYKFDAQTGQVFRATMTARNSNIQPWLMLLGPNGYSVSSTSCGSGAGACLDAVLPDYGTYQVYARSSANQGGYRLLFDFGDDKTDEPNNSPDDWANISLGGPHFAAIDPVGDIDYYSIFGQTPGRILRLTLGLPPGIGLAHARVEVLDDNLEVMVADVLSADNPSLVFAVPTAANQQYHLRITDADNGTGAPGAIYYWATAEWIGPYVSADVDGLGGRNARKQADLLYREVDYDGAVWWNMAFDASDVGITQDVTAAEFLPNGTLLLALSGTQTVAGLGKVTPYDIIRFVPNPYGLGDYTSGVFQWYLDGSDVGLTTAGEKIDAISLSSVDPDNFELVVSLTGSGTVPKTGGGTIAVRDEDQIRLENGVYGAATTGTWAMHLDGSTVPGLAAEDVRGATLAQAPAGLGARGAALLLMENAFVIDGVRGDNRDVLLAWQGFAPTALDVLGLAFDNLGDKKLDAISVGPVISE